MKTTRKFLSGFLCMIMCVAIIMLNVYFFADASSTLYWPVPNHTSLSQGFHDGSAIDISDGSISGASIVAAMSGKVTNVFTCAEKHYGDFGDCYGFGTGVVILGDDGRYYQYAHMKAYSVPSNVYVGAYIYGGTKIGEVGTTGYSSGAHLHFGISNGSWYNQSGINPLSESFTYLTAPIDVGPQTHKMYISYSANGGSIDSSEYKLSGSFIYTYDSSLYNQVWTYNEPKESGLSNASTFGLKRKGYTFLGWGLTQTQYADNGTYFDQKDATLVPTNFSSAIANEDVYLTMYAQWVPNELTVSYNANGGSLDSTDYYLDGYKIYETATNERYYQHWVYNNTKENGLNNASSFGLKRTGYTFLGWGLSKTQYADNGTYFDQKDATFVPTDFTDDIINGNSGVTMYAQWIPNELTVSYNANGGSLDSTDYYLDGYKIYETATNERYYQHWVYNNTKENGLNNASSFGLKRTGYTFLGWGLSKTQYADNGTYFDQKDATFVPTDFTDDIINGNSGVTMYAQWIPNELTVSYNANGGSLDSTDYYLDGYKIYETATNERYYQHWVYNNTKENGLNNASSFGLKRTGYTFLGWGLSKTQYADNGTYFDQKDATFVPTDFTDDIINGNSGVTMYAQWVPKTYNIVFDSNGGLCSTASKTVIYDSTYDALPLPTKSGSTFTGWYTAKTGGTKITETTKVSITSSQTLYAQWTASHEHTYTTSTVAPTCTEKGYTVHNCSCGYSYVDKYMNALGHDYKYTYNNDATAEKDGTETQICTRCHTEGETRTKVGTKIGSAKIEIKGYKENVTVDYRATLILHSTYSNLPEGAEICWIYADQNDELQYYFGDTLIINEMRKSTEIKTCVVFRDKENVENTKLLTESETVKVQVKISFFAKVIAFFRGLFGILPEVELK